MLYAYGKHILIHMWQKIVKLLSLIILVILKEVVLALLGPKLNLRPGFNSGLRELNLRHKFEVDAT